MAHGIPNGAKGERSRDKKPGGKEEGGWGLGAVHAHAHLVLITPTQLSRRSINWPFLPPSLSPFLSRTPPDESTGGRHPNVPPSLHFADQPPPPPLLCRASFSARTARPPHLLTRHINLRESDSIIGHRPRLDKQLPSFPFPPKPPPLIIRRRQRHNQEGGNEP